MDTQATTKIWIPRQRPKYGYPGNDKNMDTQATTKIWIPKQLPKYGYPGNDLLINFMYNFMIEKSTTLQKWTIITIMEAYCKKYESIKPI